MSSKDKVTKQKDPKRQAAGLKAHEKHMLKLKEEILKNSGSDSGNGTNDSSSTTTNGTNDSSSTTTNGSNTSTTASSYVNFNHVYGVGAVAVLAVAVCVFVIPKLTTNLKSTKAEPKDVEKKPNIRRKML